ncbi:MAG: PLP-dependent aminotransferase family protein, partial [Clostridium sp.]|nr:PLP-dependent aminotransferase family protein [Clostridium sp.]
MLTYTLGAAPGTPLYIALYRSIRADILAGKLEPGEKLPSKRSLAQHMKISVITVENAYAQLLAEGYIYAVARKGYFASAVEHAPEPPARSAAPAAAPLEPPYFMDFRSNHPDCARFPFSVWSRILRDELSRRETKLLAATPASGAEELREAIAAYLLEFRGMRVSAEQIIVGAGSEYLYNLIVQLLGRKHVYAVENPGHVKIPRIYEKNGIDVRYVNVDDRGMPVAELRASGADVVHLSPSHHFPTGVVMPIGRRQ